MALRGSGSWKAYEARKRIRKAAADPEILTRKIGDTMRMFGLCHRSATEAKRLAFQDLVVSEDGRKTLKVLNKDKEKNQLRETLFRANERYPGIVPKLVRVRNLAWLGRRYGLTRARVSQLKETVKLFAIKTNTPVFEVVRSVEKIQAV